MINLTIGILLISVALTYHQWAKLRVQFLRQTLFDVRNQLWDDVRAMGKLEDPAYQATRQFLNSLISICGYLSIDTIKIICESEPPEGNTERMRSENLDLDKLLDEARTAAADKVVTYVLFHRVSGYAFMARKILSTGVANLVPASKASYHSIRNAVYSKSWITVDSYERVQRSGHPIQTG